MLTAESYDCRLIVDPPLEGAWNMAVDEALLEDAADRGTATLRFYQWREPTLSLGYFQPYQQRFSHAASRDVALVRRLSGGGALLHDRELTYSLCLPAAHPMARQSAELYHVVHRAAIRVAARWNLQASLVGEHAMLTPSEEEPFLCFSPRNAADVVLAASGTDTGDAKIIGSAQRRRRGAVLQHGSLLLGASAAAPELDGVNDLCVGPISAADVILPWQEALAADLGLRLAAGPLPSDLRETAQRLQAEKFAAKSWTQRR
jgi:lipoate-protein ligase A